LNEEIRSLLVCLIGEDFDDAVAQWDEAGVFSRVYEEWKFVKMSQWSDELLNSFDTLAVQNSYVVEAELMRNRFRYRFVGDRAAEIFGERFTGYYLDELQLGEVGGYVADVFGKVIEENKPAVLRGIFMTASGDGFVAERLLLPLSSTGNDVDIILGVISVTS